MFSRFFDEAASGPVTSGRAIRHERSILRAASNAENFLVLGLS